MSKAVSESIDIRAYDVFLSFRGEDTRRSFTGNLYNYLEKRGIHTFIGDYDFESGEEIKASLSEAIERSRVFVIVFSENYASSSWCLDELVRILDFTEDNHRPVIPVFYYVDPSDVRHQKGIYGEALAMHERRLNHESYKVMKWRNALRQAATLSGWPFKHGDGYEYELIEKIVEDISNKIKISRPVVDRPVGLEYRMLEVNWLLDATSLAGVHVIGICGMGGIGKTTLARAVYHSAAGHFDTSCFLGNVRENAMKHGLVHLQQTLLAEIFRENNIRLTSVEQGISLIKKRLHRKRLLLVLDDVRELEDLQALVGSPDWFGPGSRVIITTRDRQLLKAHGVDKVYEVEVLANGEALKLLCWKAFRTDRVHPDFISKLNRAIAFASGIPLVLELIGSSLYGRGIEEWESTLDQYEKNPHRDIHMALKISFDALSYLEKEVFLDIACFFNGFELAEIEHILGAHHGCCLKIHIGALVEKSLIMIDEHGCVQMHDLMQQMGREIVRQESQEHPGKRSRLWSTEDIVRVLEDNTVRNI